MLQSMNTTDTWRGYQGPVKPPPMADAGTDPDPTTKCGVDVGSVTEPLAAPETPPKLDVGSVTELEHSVEVGAESAPQNVAMGTEPEVGPPKIMVEAEMGTDPLPPPPAPEPSASSSSTAPKLAKPLPKKSSLALNEASQLSDPNKIVDWQRIIVMPALLDGALAALGREPHIRTRMPRFDEMYAAVMKKLVEPEVQKAAAEFNLNSAETQALLACPPV